MMIPASQSRLRYSAVGDGVISGKGINYSLFNETQEIVQGFVDIHFTD